MTDQPQTTPSTAWDCPYWKCREDGVCHGVTYGGCRDKTTTSIERVARAVREEIVRQYRDDERGRCPAGRAFYEENISPWLIAQRAIAEYEECKQHG